MRPLLLRVVVVVVGVLFGGLTSVVPPVSATTYPVVATLESGRRDIATQTVFGTFNRDTPGSGIPGCDPSKTLTAGFDDVAGSVDGFAVSIVEPLVLPIFGVNYQLEVSSVSSTAGTWNPATGEWFGVRADFEIVVRDFNPIGCVAGEIACEATLDMEFGGTTRFGVEGPIPGPSGPVWIDGFTERRITTVSVCQNIWGTFLPGADVRIEDNPVSPMPGAEFR